MKKENKSTEKKTEKLQEFVKKQLVSPEIDKIQPKIPKEKEREKEKKKKE